MFDFSNVTSAGRIEKQWILDRVTDYQIFSYYFGNLKIGRAYHSRLRKDTVPSVGFFIHKSGELLYRDFRNNDILGWVQYVQRLFNCSYKDALLRVASDFGLNGSPSGVSKDFLDRTKEFDRTPKPMSLIQVMEKKWDKEALDWWRLYEITEEELKANNIYNVGKAFINKKEIYNPNDFLRFAYLQEYIEDDGSEHEGIKLYTPEDPDFKWMTSIPLHIPFGLEKLKYQSDTCWVMKSQKDRVEMLKIYSDVIATQNESEDAFCPELEQHLLKRFKHLIIGYGADPQGVESCKRITTRSGQRYFNTPKSEYDKRGIEDPADYIRFYGLDAFKDLLKEKNFL